MDILCLAVPAVASLRIMARMESRPATVDDLHELGLGTGERYDDVVVLWVPCDGDKLALVQDARLSVRRPVEEKHGSRSIRRDEV
jgi:hypothetical protein